MRGLFGLVGLLLVLAVAGVLVRKQMAAVQAPVPALQTPAGEVIEPPAGDVRQQSQQQYKQALEGALQTPRPIPDDQ